MAKKTAAQKAQQQYDKGMADEARARSSVYPDAIHEDVGAANAAKAEVVAAHDELYKLREEVRLGVSEEGRKLVTLVGPNEYANVVDNNGVEFRNGKAEVERHLAERYVADLEGYEIQGDSKPESK